MRANSDIISANRNEGEIMKLRLSLVVFALALTTLACGFQAGTAPQDDAVVTREAVVVAQDCPELGPFCPGADEPFLVVGSFEYSNSIITDYYDQHAVALVDMYAFITRDKEWEIPISSQTLGFLEMDLDEMVGTYVLQLPKRPTGVQADVDNDNQDDPGVQVFAVAYWPNLVGGPYAHGDDGSRGWPGYLTSARTDTDRQYEVIGGKLIVWSPDENQQFPTGFGEDGLLFTEDDPVGPIPAGYTIVDLDSEPFRFYKEPEPELPLYEPKDVAIKDFSEDSYTEAFEQMFEFVRINYAFNGIEGKQPDWDALYDELKPRVEQAEQSRSARAFYEALRDFTWAFRDGHVGLNGGDYANQDFFERTAGGYGFAVRELDDGSVVVMFVTEGGPAQAAGMQVGAVVTEFGGQPVAEAIGAAQPFAISSSDFAHRYQQQRYFLRTAVGVETQVTFQNPGQAARTVTLVSSSERDSFNRTSVYYNVDFDNMLPVTFEILSEGNAEIGYVEVNSNYDDLGLILKLFERALRTFEERNVAGVIIDMRFNSGGANLGLAGFLTEIEIPMGQMEYFSEQSGQFEPRGLPGKVIANQNQYRFDKTVLLIGQACASACELESYAFSQVPEMITVGMYPTAGVEAEVARGQFRLPEGFSLQVPTGRMTLPDGSIFLEGVGVPPDVRVPITFETVTTEEDVVLQYGIRAVLEPSGTGVVPTGPPKLLSPSQSMAALESGNITMLEEKAREVYDAQALTDTKATFTYTVVLGKSEPLFWAWGWCAQDEETLLENLTKIQVRFDLNGQDVPLEQFVDIDYPTNDGQYCRAYFVQVTDFPGGEHSLVTTATFTAPVNDGKETYPAGQQRFEYTVFVKP
jgi:C-terminal processing protease CtpA/Prc